MGSVVVCGGGCQGVKGKRTLSRIVDSSDGTVALDPTGKRAGRGAYICHDVSCLEIAQKKKALERALKRDVSVDIYERLNQDLRGVAESE